MSCVDPVIAESKKRKVDSNVYGASSSSSSAATFSLTIKKSHLTLLVRLNQYTSTHLRFLTNDIMLLGMIVFILFDQSIPVTFAKEHMPKVRTKFVIHDPKGKPWEVVYVPSNGSKLFSSGWRFLANGYGLAVGDLCTFRLVRPKEMVLEVLHDSP